MPALSYSQEVKRKAVHLSSLWMPVLILNFPHTICLICFSSLLLLNVLVEYGYYKKHPLIVKSYGRLFSNMLRSKETGEQFRFSGSPYVLGAALCSCLFFPPLSAATALSVMLVSDTAAALIGKAWGKHKINHNTKSLEGSLAFFLSGVLVIFVFAQIFHMDHSFILRGLIGTLIASFAETYENILKIDDNFSIPLIIGCCLSL